MIIASGGGRRIGGPQALLRLDGQPLVERGIGTLREAGCSPVVVVLGSAADEVRRTADLSGAKVVVNRAWGTGLGSSLRAGLKVLTDNTIEAVVVIPADMPGVTPEAVRRVAALPYPDALVCATYDGLRGYPMLFGRRHWAGIVALANADVGARPYLLAHKDEIVDISCDSVSDGRRVDSPQLAAAFGLTGAPAPAPAPVVETVASGEPSRLVEQETGSEPGTDGAPVPAVEPGGTGLNPAPAAKRRSPAGSDIEAAKLPVQRGRTKPRRKGRKGR